MNKIRDTRDTITRVVSKAISIATTSASDGFTRNDTYHATWNSARYLTETAINQALKDE